MNQSMKLGTLRSIRFAVLGLILALLAAPAGMAPSAAAAPINRCADMFGVTKSPPPTDKLPGFGAPDLPPATYDYENPGEAARGLQLPDNPGELARYGTNTDGKTPGTKEHVYTAWNRYQQRKAEELKKWQANPTGKKPSDPLPWNKWLNSYVPNMGNAARGNEYERYAVRTIGLGGGDWLCQERIPGAPVDRVYDAVNHKEKIAYEFKSGRGIDTAQLAKDQEIARRTGYRIQYVFGQKPSQATNRRLADARLQPPVHAPATGQVTNRGVTLPGPVTEPLNPDPRKLPSNGSLSDMIGRSGKNAEQAREIAAVDEENGRLSRRPDQALRRPGGIDFSTMELRYLSEASDGSGVRYAFHAGDNPNEDQEPSFGGLEAAQLSSDALFTWLALPQSSFWVNLNPDQPDKIMDDKLASTDAGRVLLQADLALKRNIAKLTVPDNDTGRQFWSSLRRSSNGQLCWPSWRVWIEPLPASVRDKNGELYILDAPLQVKMERLEFHAKPNQGACAATEDVLNYNFGKMDQIVRPKVEEAVNTAPEYEDLRRVYYARVAAEWIRQRNAATPSPYALIIGSGDASRWPARTPWSKQAVYQEYLKSYKDGEFQYYWVDTNNGVPWIYQGKLGGVDFAQSPRDPMADGTFAAKYPALPATVQDSRQAPVDDRAAPVTWLGGEAAPRKQPPPVTTQPTQPQPPQSQPMLPGQPPATGPGQPPATAAPGKAAPSPASATKGKLALTGAPLAGLLAAALGLLAAGITLVTWRRRRRTASAPD